MSQCRKKGHRAADCNSKKNGDTVNSTTPGEGGKGNKDKSKIKCFKCKKMGYYANECKSKKQENDTVASMFVNGICEPCHDDGLDDNFFDNDGLSEDFGSNKSYDDSETFDEVNLMFWNPSQDGPLPTVHKVEKVDCFEWSCQVFKDESSVPHVDEEEKLGIISRAPEESADDVTAITEEQVFDIALVENICLTEIDQFGLSSLQNDEG